MRDFLTNQYVLLTLTFGAFFGAKLLQKRTGWILLNPILLAIAAIIAFLMLCDIPYETYQQSAGLIDFWLKPAVVALGVPLYLQLSSIRKQLIPILMSQFIGCVVGIVSVVLTAKLLGATPMVVVSLASKSVTTPIAMEVTKAVDGIPSLTAAIVVITGLLGAVAGFQPYQGADGTRTVDGRGLARPWHLGGDGARRLRRRLRQPGPHAQRHPHRPAHADGAGVHPIKGRAHREGRRQHGDSVRR